MKTIFYILAFLIIAAFIVAFVFVKRSAPPADTQFSGFNVEVLQDGEGEGTKQGDTLTVHYVGTLEDGTKFDSSRDRGEPFEVKLGAGQVIPGWELGLLGMKKGEVRRIVIPPALAYGEQGVGPIPPNATLVFEVELLEIK